VDVIDGTYCNLSNLPDFREYHTQNGNLVCGGEYWDSRSHCLLFVNGEWVRGPDLVMGRTYHTSWTVDSDLTLLVGGGSSQTSTELVDTSMNSSTLYFDLIYPSVWSCLIDEGSSFFTYWWKRQ